MNEEVHDQNEQGREISLGQSASVSALRRRMADMSEIIQMKKDFLKTHMKENVHFGTVPGVKKPFLWQAGAQSLLDWYGYYATFTPVAEKEDFDLGFFAYTYRCVIKQKGSNVIVGDCEGDASSNETKYRFEWAFENEVPEGVDKTKCDTREIGKNKTKQYRINVANPADKRNTLRKMAQKRALVGATLLATGTSDLFVNEDGVKKGNALSSAGIPAGQSAEPDGYKALIKYEMKSKFGDESRPSHCAFCEQKHVLTGDPVVAVELNGKTVYGDEECLAKWWLQEHPPEVNAPAEHGEQPTSDATKESAEQPVDPQKSESEPLTGLKITQVQIKSIFSTFANKGKTEKDFEKFLHEKFSKYSGKKLNDILQSDYELIAAAWGGKV